MIFNKFTIVIFRTIAVHFTNPFHVSTRVVDKCNDGALLLQVEFSPVWHMCIRVIAYVWQLLHYKIWNPNIFFKKIILLALLAKKKVSFFLRHWFCGRRKFPWIIQCFAYLGASGAHGTWVHVFDQTMASLNRGLANPCKYVPVHLYFSLNHASNSLCGSKKKYINLIFACTSRWLLQLDQFSPFRC
jgi:hypothetical protein